MSGSADDNDGQVALGPGERQDEVFVYGTLRRGERRGGVIDELKPVQRRDGVVRGRLFIEPGGEYPIITPGEDRVVGELIRFPDIETALARLDPIEGFERSGDPENLYERVRVQVDLGGGDLRTAWVYVMTVPTPGSAPLGGGDWCVWRRARDRG